MLEKLGEGVGNLWGYLFGDGPEEDVRAFEDERLRDSRERRRQARVLLARRKEEDAERDRTLAGKAADPEVASALLEDAELAEQTARKLRGGHIGLLNAMGIPTEELMNDGAGGGADEEG